MKQHLLYLFLFFSVGISHGQQINFNDLTVVNLEEDKGPFATMNDEIAIWLIKINTEHDIILSWEHTEELVFSDSVQSFDLKLEKEISLDSFDLVFVALVEFDSENNLDSVNLKLKETFLEYYGFPLTLLKEKIRLAIRDDDILGLTSFRFEDPKLKKEQFTFKGMHMFNRFEYLLRFR